MSKYCFTLRNIIPHELDIKYKISTLNFRTRIINLSSNSEPQNYSYLDEIMKDHLCIISMRDYLGKVLPIQTNISCFWCHHKFKNYPIGCPIDYIPSILIKEYFSEISKDMYHIRGEISPNIKEHIQNLNNKNKLTELNIIEKDYYLTDGIFCSFNCCLAFIHKNKKYPTYLKSENLLNKIFYSFFDLKLKLDPAPSWRLLTKYGGLLSIEEFRKSFNKILYTDLDEWITDTPICKPIGFIFEKKIKF